MAGGRRGVGEGPKRGNLVGPNPTDRAKNGVQKSLLVEQDGGPLSSVIAGANVPDARLLAETLAAVVVERPAPEPGYEPPLCLDKGFDNDTGWEATVERDSEPHIALIRDQRPPRPKRFKPKRWGVERTLAWLSQCRAILIRIKTVGPVLTTIVELDHAIIAVHFYLHYFRLTTRNIFWWR